MADSTETLYEVLGLEPRASREQVEKAYRFCLDMYGEGALATYSLLAADEVKAVRARIAAAYEVLADPTRRRDYDVSLGLASPAAPLLPFPSAASAPAPVPAEVGGPRSEHSGVPLELPERITGGELKRIREARGVSLREIAGVTKIGVRYLEYIEEDRFAMLPAPVYLRGFLMEYGRVLGLDPRRTAEAYMARLPPRP